MEVGETWWNDFDFKRYELKAQHLILVFSYPFLDTWEKKIVEFWSKYITIFTQENVVSKMSTILSLPWCVRTQKMHPVVIFWNPYFDCFGVKSLSLFIGFVNTKSINMMQEFGLKCYFLSSISHFHVLHQLSVWRQGCGVTCALSV